MNFCFVFLQCISPEGSRHNGKVFWPYMLSFHDRDHRQALETQLQKYFDFLSIALLKQIQSPFFYLFVVEFKKTNKNILPHYLV